MSSLALLGPIAWRNLWRNPRRTAITLAVVAIGMWSILAFGVFLKAWADSSREESLRLLTGEGQIHAPGYLDDPGVAHSMPAPAGALLAALGDGQVSAWAPRVRVPAIIQSEYRTRAVTFLGVTPAAERKVSDLPGQILAGRYLASESEPALVIGRDLAAKLKTRVGKRVIILTQAADGHLAEVGLPIVGVFGNTTAAQDEYVFTGLSTAQQMLGMPGRLSEISFDATDETRIDAVVAALKRAGPGLDIESWMQLSPLGYAIETFGQTFVGVWLLIVYVLMAIGIVNTQLMAVFERTREFGLLQALGMKPGMIVAQVMIESLLLIGLGIVVGVALMLATVAVFSNGLDFGQLGAGAEMVGGASVIYPKFDPGQAVVLSLIVWGLGALAAWWPARRASQASPVSAMGEA